LMAGVAIFATVFAMGANPGEGAGLIFVVLPTIFPEIAGGAIWGTLFFFLLFMAALTSAISILEVITAYFIDEKGWSRQKATIIFGSVITGVGALCSLSMGTYNITALAGMSFFDVLDYLSSKYMLPIGGMLTGVFVLVRWGIPNFISEMVVGMKNPKVNATFVRILFLVSATVVGFILINEIIATITGTPIIG